MSTAWPLPEPDDPQPHRKLTLHHQRVTDSITNTAEHGSAPDHTAARRDPDSRRADPTPQATIANAAGPAGPDTPLEWDLSDLDPQDLEQHPWTDFAGPEYPDPSWPGWLADTSEPSMTYVLAVSPWLLKRYPDRAANLWAEVFPLGRYVHWRDPEPDLEAEP